MSIVPLGEALEVGLERRHGLCEVTAHERHEGIMPFRMQDMARLVDLVGRC